VGGGRGSKGSGEKKKEVRNQNLSGFGRRPLKRQRQKKNHESRTGKLKLF